MDLILETDGFEDSTDRLAEVQRRILAPRPAWEYAMTEFERSHERHFRKMKGRYVDTGQTRASLTGRTDKSIREIMDDRAVFGSRRPQSVWLTKRDEDVENYQLPKRRKGRGRYAVGVLDPRLPRKVRKVMADHILDGWRNG